MTTPIEDEPRRPDMPPVGTEEDYAEHYREPYDVTTTAGYSGGSIELTNVTLGLEPFILIRAKTLDEDDREGPDDDGLRLKTLHNDEGPNLALLYVMNLPAEQNPLTAAIKAVLDANADRADYPVMSETLHLFAEFCDIPMPESGK
jgi:hypothetical protein